MLGLAVWERTLGSPPRPAHDKKGNLGAGQKQKGVATYGGAEGQEVSLGMASSLAGGSLSSCYSISLPYVAHVILYPLFDFATTPGGRPEVDSH